MQKEEWNISSSLSRRIFLYLLGGTLVTVLVLGFFWIDGKLNDYHKELKLLKQTFSDTKKQEIKNKILLVKDYIQWVQEMPIKPISQTLCNELNQLKLSIINKEKVTSNIPDSLLQAFKDSICHSRVPIYIMNYYGKVVYSFNPFTLSKDKKLSEEEKALIHEIQERNTTDKGTALLYKVTPTNDSILKGIACFDNKTLSGFKVVSIVNSEYFENVLQISILDSISRLRYSENEYIFINSIGGKALLTNGRYNKSPVDIFASGNTAWINIFKVQQSTAIKPGGVFHTYTWQKLSDSTKSLKTSYFSYITKWKWIIGTGFYEDDVNSILDLKRKALASDMRKTIFKVMCYLLMSSLLSYILVVFFSRRLGKNIELFRNFFEKATHESLMIDKSQVNYREFASMAEAANLMVEELKKATANLQKSEEKFSKAFKNSPDAILITSIKDGNVIEANETTSETTGYSRSEIIGGSIVNLNLWVNRINRNNYIKLLNKHGRVHNLEADFLMKSGEIRNGLISGEIIEIEEHKYILSVIRDITEIRKTENDLKEREAHYRYLFEQNPAPMLIYELSSLKIFAVNEAFANHYGYSLDEAVSMQLTDLYPANEKKAIYDLITKLKGLAYVGEWHHLKKNGTQITIEVNSHRISYEGHPARIDVINDITMHKQMEEALRINENQLSAIYNTISDILYLISVEPNEKYVFVSVNEMFLKTTGLKLEQVISKTTGEVIPPSAHNLVHTKYREAIESKKTIFWEEVSDYPTGKKYGLVTVTPTFNSNGICTNLVGSVHDITEIRESENEIRKLNTVLENRVFERTAQLESINKELESFSYSISHDLRAPLRAIFGFSQIISSRHRSSLNDEGRQYMDYIVEASIRMEHLINDLLNYSRLGRKSLEMHPVSLYDIVNSIYSDFKHQLKEINAKFSMDKELPQITGDETLLRQIFTNLIGNAITYRRSDVPLIIGINYTTNKNDLILEVSDNGIGIPKEYWEKIFNVFQRLHSEDQYPGTGIGLATVKKAVAILGGSVWVESEPGKGSTFFIKIPDYKI